jgi:predicted amidohydrolase YtcJ
MDNTFPYATAIAVKNEKIISIGFDSDILPLKEENTTVIDLRGRLLLPGFNDSHMHLLSFGNLLKKIDLSDTSSINEIISKSKVFLQAKNIPKDKWILGAGWNDDFLQEKRFLTRYDLDMISNEQPICFTRACYHVAVVNSKALEILNISKNTPLVEGGHFDVDENGEPLGIFRENAVSLIYSNMPEPTLEEIKELIIEASHKASMEGITSIQTDDFGHIASDDYEKIITAYKVLIQEDKLTVRINEQCLLPEKYILESFINKGYKTGQGDDYFKIGPIKLLTDGSLGARTALLSKPYNDMPSTYGISIYEQAALDELIETAHKNHCQLAVHCIGDGAMMMTFNSFEKAMNKFPRSNCRHSIVHCQITNEELLDKFKESDIIAHIQPIFLDYDLHIVEDRVGVELAATSYNWKTMLNKNIHIACGSDCPVEYFNVLKGIYCAVTRKDLKGFPENSWLPEQKLTVEEAVYGFTMGGAYASFEENTKGSISIGKLADMVVLTDNIFTIPEDKIKDVEVIMTFLGGKLVYKKA